MVWLTLAGALRAQDTERTFVADQAYDTVTTVGDAFTEVELFVYRAAFWPQLVDSTTVVFAEAGAGRIVLADLLTGRGFAIDDGGGLGPGEFGGQTPMLSSSNGALLTLSSQRRGAKFSVAGDLLDTHSYASSISAWPETPLGLLSNGSAVTVTSMPIDSRRSGRQTLPRVLHAYGPSGEEVLSFDSIPPGEVVVEIDDGRPIVVEGSEAGLIGHARHETVVVAENRASWLMVFDGRGRLKGQIDVGHEVFRPFVDADGRIWVQVWTRNEEERGSWIVFDSEGMEPIMHVAESDVQDAWGDFIITIRPGEHGEMLMTLLRRRID